MMAINKDGKFIALIWQPDDPTRVVTYREKIGEKWAGLDWRFGCRSNNCTILIDDLIIFSFESIKNSKSSAWLIAGFTANKYTRLLRNTTGVTATN